ncbi:hypothetical protein JNW90_33045 [Micromonospora sp. STR1s_5]|nr:hypothetical protein [Micromonospora sp. STR1s_5]
MAEADDEDPDGGEQGVAAEVDLAFGRIAVAGRTCSRRSFSRFLTCFRRSDKSSFRSITRRR